ncbi:MAG: hypothetical protein WED09_08400 [Homoserinimonas sp.]
MDIINLALEAICQNRARGFELLLNRQGLSRRFLGISKSRPTVRLRWSSDRSKEAASPTTVCSTGVIASGSSGSTSVAK